MIRVSRLVRASLAVAAALSGPMSGSARADDATPVRILMNWFARADQAGYWQAQIDNLGKTDGLKITALQGGPKIQTIPQVAAGQAEFGMGDSEYTPLH